MIRKGSAILGAQAIPTRPAHSKVIVKHYPTMVSLQSKLLMTLTNDGYGFIYNSAADCTCSGFCMETYVKVSRHDTDIVLLKFHIMSDKLAHDREIKDVKEALRSLAAKLDSIEQALRDK